MTEPQTVARKVRKLNHLVVLIMMSEDAQALAEFSLPRGDPLAQLHCCHLIVLWGNGFHVFILYAKKPRPKVLYLHAITFGFVSVREVRSVRGIEE